MSTEARVATRYRDSTVNAQASLNTSNGQFLDTEAQGVKVAGMPLTPEQLAEQAMSLHTEDRARLADLIVESLNAADLTPIDRAWIDEARKRRDEVRSGAVKPIPAEEAFKKVRDSLKR